MLISICISIFDILNVKHENPMLNIKDNSDITPPMLIQGQGLKSNLKISLR
jgi:hypothetical protein